MLECMLKMGQQHLVISIISNREFEVSEISYIIIYLSATMENSENTPRLGH